VQQRSEETQARILDAAVRRFSISGFNGASVDDICSDAGVSKGAFYHHYSTKQAVFLALLNGWLGTIESGLKAVRQDNVPQTLLNMTGMLPVIFASADNRLPMFLEFWLQASRDETVHQAMIAPYRNFTDFFTKLIETGILEGSLKEVDPGIISQAIISIAIGTLLQGLLDPDKTNWSTVAEQSIQALLVGVIKTEETNSGD
jgi:AcrR family transcriptional regulator